MFLVSSATFKTCSFHQLSFCYGSYSSSSKMKALNGIKVIELAGLAPVPFCGKILADFGAFVTHVSKNGAGIEQKLLLGKTQITMDYKKILENFVQ